MTTSAFCRRSVLVYVPLSSNAMLAATARFEKRMPGSALGSHGSVLNVQVSAFDDDDEEKTKNLLVQ